MYTISSMVFAVRPRLLLEEIRQTAATQRQTTTCTKTLLKLNRKSSLKTSKNTHKTVLNRIDDCATG